jgi:YycE-like protein
MVGLPGDRYYLELTSHEDGSPGRAPTDENLLVLYFATAEQMFDVLTRLGDAGHQPVELANPWWADNSALAFADPDNWRIVLMPKAGSVGLGSQVTRRSTSGVRSASVGYPSTAIVRSASASSERSTCTTPSSPPIARPYA